MGNSPSRPSPSPEAAAQEKALLERLRAMQLDKKGASDEDYVHVGAKNQGGQASEKGPRVAEPREPESLSVSDAERWQEALLKDPKNRLAISALSTADPRNVLTSRAALIADQHVFNVQIPFEGGPITNQRSSGRCWLFASTNVFRVALMQKYELDSFELSQAYLFFWDKLEKANWFLEQILSTLDEPLDSRLMQTLLQAPLSDGGQWDMVHNLVEKYGLVPQALYPDSFSARSSSVLNNIVFTKLRDGALYLRHAADEYESDGRTPAEIAAGLTTIKTNIVRQIHTVLTLTLGPPPAVDAEFEWEFVDRTGRARAVRTTPRAFARDIHSTPSFSSSLLLLPGGGSGSFVITAADVAAMVSLVDDPRNPTMRLLTVDRLGNVVGGRGVRYVNVGMPTLKRACVAQLRAGVPVFFGCDVGKCSGRDSGVMDTSLVDYGIGFGGAFEDTLHDMGKEARLLVGESAMTHAMVLTGVHVDERTGRPVRWRVQNSWGEEAGKGGWFVMTDGWMDAFVYQAVVDPRFLSREVRDVLDGEPIVLPLWDPMGSLA